MDVPEYQKLADKAFRRIERALADIDPDDVDCELAGDVLTLTFKGGAKCVINTQRPTRQIWLAATSRAWHFTYDPATERWMDDKGQGTELFALVGESVKKASGIDVAWP
jgi:CyaY protein